MGGGFRHVVPGIDSLANETDRDVIGNKLDTIASESLYGKLHRLEEHFHATSLVYPTLANAVAVAGAGAWALGAFVQLVPAGTIGTAFDIHFVNVESATANTNYQLLFYYGATDIFAGECRFTKTAVMDTMHGVPVLTPVMPLDSRIRVKLASQAGGPDTATISIQYHPYV